MDHCYWEGTGKYQALANKLDDTAPRFGYTANKNVNVYLTLVHLYYDAYNNGGGNIADCYMQDVYANVLPHLPDITAYPFIRCEFETMEKMMDQVLEYLQDKDLSFPVYTIWMNYEQDTLSRVQPPESDLDSWVPITFGEEDRMNKYCLHRTGNSRCRDVTDEICAQKEAHPNLDSAIQNATEASTKNQNEPSKTMQPEGR